MVNNKKGKALTDFYENFIFIDFIVPRGERHGVCLAKEFREALDIRLGLVILYNFALGRVVPYWGAFTYITGVTLQIIKNATSG